MSGSPFAPVPGSRRPEPEKAVLQTTSASFFSSHDAFKPGIVYFLYLLFDAGDKISLPDIHFALQIAQPDQQFARPHLGVFIGAGIASRSFAAGGKGLLRRLHALLYVLQLSRDTLHIALCVRSLRILFRQSRIIDGGFGPMVRTRVRFDLIER